MYERFTDEARQAIMDAQIEARALGHDHVGTEHLLLGVLPCPVALSSPRSGSRSTAPGPKSSAR